MKENAHAFRRVAKCEKKSRFNAVIIFYRSIYDSTRGKKNPSINSAQFGLDAVRKVIATILANAY